VVRVALTTGLGYLCSIPLPIWLGIDPRWGAAGLTASAGVAGWVEFALLRGTLNRRIGRTGLPAVLMAKLWSASALAAGAAWAVKFGIGLGDHPIKAAVAILGTYGVVYFAVAYLLKVDECAKAFQRVARLRR
jgi:putative peptidoglycan lipid II flippase